MYPGGSRASIRGQWRGLREAREAGWARTLGVSNFELTLTLTLTLAVTLAVTLALALTLALP